MACSEKDRQILLSILSYLDGIHRTHIVFKNDPEIFRDNVDYQYSVAFALIQVGELTGKLEVDIPDKVNIRSLRNRIVHGYGSIDKEQLWEISHQDVRDLRHAIEALLGV
jgi:uncharacterized protein with HEPN domain